MINASPLNTSVINGSLAAESGDLLTGEAVLAFNQNVSGYAGQSGVKLLQKVGALGDAQVVFEQAVAYASGQAEIQFMQSVGGHGFAALGFTQNVYSVAAVNFANWSIAMTLDGVDISAQLVGSVSIVMERNAARLADFTVSLSGVVDALSWVGRVVTIDYTQNNNVVWRRFTGVIIEPVLDLTTMELTCTCSDDSQRIIDNHSNETLLALSGGSWSKYVFDEAAVGWDYLQDVLSTVANSVEIDAFGALRANSWQNKPVADFTFDVGIIDDASLSVEFGQRSGLINRVDIEFNSRFERLYQRPERLFWARTESFCQNYVAQIINPTKTMVREAVDAAGWVLLTERYTELWPTNFYSCVGGQVGWINADNDAIRGFDITAVKRWKQSVTHQFKLSVIAPASVAAYRGELATRLSGAADFETAEDDWGDSAAVVTDYTLPAHFSIDDQGNRYFDDIGTIALNDALETLIAVAAETINASHRANFVRWTMPLAPYLELSHTLAVNVTALQAKGIVGRIEERYNFDSGEATTDVTLWLSSGQSGLDTAVQTFAAPAAPTLSVNNVFNEIELQTYIGDYGAESFNDSWVGVITNRDYSTGQLFTSSPDGDLVEYPVEMRLPFSAVPDDKTQNRTDQIAHEIAISVPHNLMTITA